MQKSVRIIGKKAIPIWLLVLALVAAGAGAAAGTVLAGKVTGETNVAVSQALLVGDNVTWESSLTADTSTNTTQPQQIYKHASWVKIPNRYFGAVADDNTAFQAAAEVATGDWVAFTLPLKNASEVDLVGLLTLNVPAGLEVEAFSATPASSQSNVMNVVRVGLNTWKFKLAAGADYQTVDKLELVISADDTVAPGFYTIDGNIKQIGY